MELRTSVASIISIHALRKESDGILPTICWAVEVFQSTLSVRRATISGVASPDCPAFQSTLSVRRATWTGEYQRHDQLISIHALRKESDVMFWTGAASTAFQSTLSVRRATGLLHI